MKKTLAVLTAVVFAAALVSCSLFETESEMGTVVVDLSGNARSADPATGLPILGTDGVFTHIRIFDEANRELLFSIQNSASASVMLAVGTRITISVDIVTDNARWHGEGVHTVGSGSNAVALKINKVPVSADKVLLWQKDSSNNIVFYAADEWNLHEFAGSVLPPLLLDSTHLPQGLDSAYQPTKVFCFDRSGNLYIVFGNTGNYFLVKYELLATGGWDAQHTQMRKLDNSHDLTAIAVDSSDNENNRLYVAHEDGPVSRIDTYSFSAAQFSTMGSAEGLRVLRKDSAQIFFDAPAPSTIKIRALAADENGLFAVLETPATGSGRVNVSVKHCSINLEWKSGNMNLFTNVESNISSDPKNVTADLCIKNGVLYAAGSLVRGKIYTSLDSEVFTSGKLWKLGQSTSFDRVSAQAQVLWEFFPAEDAIEEANLSDKQKGYAPCKFNTGKQSKLITASDGCYGKKVNGSSPADVQNKNSVLFFDIDDGALIKQQKVSTKFMKELSFNSVVEIFKFE
ncbi:hypothetical protein [Treponema lecithinolyticum]|nr:hypothetical protein [Treponema lecithinolyticum]